MRFPRPTSNALFVVVVVLFPCDDWVAFLDFMGLALPPTPSPGFCSGLDTPYSVPFFCLIVDHTYK